MVAFLEAARVLFETEVEIGTKLIGAGDAWSGFTPAGSGWELEDPASFRTHLEIQLISVEIKKKKEGECAVHKEKAITRLMALQMDYHLQTQEGLRAGRNQNVIRSEDCHIKR